MSPALVIGGSGQLGTALLPHLRERGIPVLATSRQERAPAPGVTWLAGSLEAMPRLPETIGTIISVGPLDAFAMWLSGAGITSARVIAISSTGRTDKLESPDPAERDLARRLCAAEAVLFEAGRQQGMAVTVLRPTLLYGNGRDHSLSRLVAFAHRWKFVPLPANATGLRQPVHVEDVAAAVLRCLEVDASAGQAYDLPGGETLAFDAMVRRTLQRHAPGSRVVMLPTAAFRFALALVGTLRRAPIGKGVIARLQRDQLASITSAATALGYAPRRFDP